MQSPELGYFADFFGRWEPNCVLVSADSRALNCSGDLMRYRETKSGAKIWKSASKFRTP